MGKRYVVVVRQECITCGGCQGVCPEVFRVDKSVGYARVIRPAEGAADIIQDAVAQCPVHCIHVLDLG